MFCRPLPLSYVVFDGPAPQPPLVFLHGLLGSKGNFRAIARALVQRSGRKVSVRVRAGPGAAKGLSAGPALPSLQWLLFPARC